jgi:hypothetical protein
MLKDGDQEVAALAEALRPLPRSPAESNEPSSGLVVKVQPERGGRNKRRGKARCGRRRGAGAAGRS